MRHMEGGTHGNVGVLAHHGGPPAAAAHRAQRSGGGGGGGYYQYPPNVLRACISAKATDSAVKASNRDCAEYARYDAAADTGGADSDAVATDRARGGGGGPGLRSGKPPATMTDPRRSARR